jgi:2-polyprenyl-3-methyl-5-hydroxy-6-metoxy-1,4-benzoquinol methylase
MYGSEKWVWEENLLRRWAYRLFGEIHVPGRLRAYHVLRALRRTVSPRQPLRVLDAGCGRGDMALFLARRNPNWHIVGFELDRTKLENACHAAQRLGLRNIEFIAGRLEALPFEDGFDIVLNADVLEHIEDDRSAIRNLCRALRPGGHVIVTSPSVPQRKHLPTVRWREKRIGFEFSQTGHVRTGYSKEDLAEKFSGAGGRVVRSYYTFGFFGTLAFDVFFSIGDSRPNPVVFALFFPWLMALSALDLVFPRGSGSAILAVARRVPTSV